MRRCCCAGSCVAVVDFRIDTVGVVVVAAQAGEECHVLARSLLLTKMKGEVWLLRARAGDKNERDQGDPEKMKKMLTFSALGSWEDSLPPRESYLWMGVRTVLPAL